MALILKGRAKLKGSTVIGKRPYAIDGVFNPELVLDFQKDYYRTNSVAKTFANAITHTRASTATYVDSTGTLQTAAINEPRLGHHVWNGSAWVNEGLLHESEARTNLLPYSEDFTNAEWSKADTTLGAGIAAPDGTTNSVKLVPNTTSAEHFVEDNLTVATGTFTDSVFAKQAELKNLLIRPVHVGADQGATQQATFDLVAGTVSNVSANCTAQIQDFGSGWLRCSFTYTVSGTITGAYQYRIQVADNSGSTVFAGDGTSGLFIFGAQREIAPTPSSYIPTAGSTVTRAADVLTVPAANLPYNSTALSIQMDGRVTYADTDGRPVEWYLWDSDSNNRIFNYLETGGVDTGRVLLAQRFLGVSKFVFEPSPGSFSPDVFVPFNIASRHGSTFVNGAINGTALTANTTPTGLPDLSTANLRLGNIYNGTIKTLRIWGQDIGDTGLVEATEPSLVPSLSLTFDGTENSFIVEDWTE